MKTNDKMSSGELEDFLERHDLSNRDFSEILGVTQPAIDHWLTGRRDVPPTTVRLLRFFDKFPDSMREFEIVTRESGR